MMCCVYKAEEKQHRLELEKLKLKESDVSADGDMARFFGGTAAAEKNERKERKEKRKADREAERAASGDGSRGGGVGGGGGGAVAGDALKKVKVKLKGKPGSA
jgi:hypothetical protein